MYHEVNLITFLTWFIKNFFLAIIPLHFHRLLFPNFLTQAWRPCVLEWRTEKTHGRVKQGNREGREETAEGNILCSQWVFLSFLWILLAPQLRASEGCSVWSLQRWLWCDLETDVVSFIPFRTCFANPTSDGSLFLNRIQSPPHTYWSLVSSNYCVMGSSDRLASVFSWLSSPEKPYTFLLSSYCMPSIIF